MYLGISIQLFFNSKNNTFMRHTKKEAVGLLVTMKAKAGKEQEVKDFLFSGLPLVLKEPKTVSWFGFQINDNTFGIFDTFELEEGRKSHLKGEVAKALLSNANHLLENFDANVNIEFVNIIADNHKYGTQTNGLLVMMNAKSGKSEVVEQFLKAGRQLIDDEPETLSWYAIKIDDTTYGIFDTFNDEPGRDAHLNGKVANALLENAPLLLHDFKTSAIQKITILACK